MPEEFESGLWQSHRLAIVLWGAVLLALLWAALAPLDAGGRERALEVAAGAAAHQALPAAITLTLGVQDVLLLRNRDGAALHFGPVLLNPGDDIRLPFEAAGVYPIAASAWSARTLTVTVVEWPSPGWERIKWRLSAFGDRLRSLPVVHP